jgi:hypothetical protein
MNPNIENRNNSVKDIKKSVSAEIYSDKKLVIKIGKIHVMTLKL